MKTTKRMLGAEHPDILISTHNLAYKWKSQNCNEEAISLVKNGFELQNQVLGPNHPNTKTSLEPLRERESRGQNSGEDKTHHSD